MAVERTGPVTREQMNELADRIEAAGPNYHEIVDNCWDAELLRQAGMELLVRSMGKSVIEALAASVRDEIIVRRLSEIKHRYPRHQESKDGG